MKHFPQEKYTTTDYIAHIIILLTADDGYCLLGCDIK
jgi:hypothetical protein